jgi:O-antigen/teichoic acid export membrane protein
VASSAVVSAIVALEAHWLAARALHDSPALIGEGTLAITCLAVSLPFVLLATLLNGLLEAYQEFALINAVRIPANVMLLITPLAVLPFSRSLGAITALLAGLRVVNAGVLVLLALHVVPQLRARAFAFRRELVRPLMSFGGWLTVSNVIGPVTVYFDRFLIAALLGGTAVAYYTVPYDVLTRLWVLPVAIQGVLFPAFVSLHEQKSPRIVPIFKRSSEATLLLVAPPVVATLLLAHEGLRLWVGEPFAQHSAHVAKILAVGVLVNSLARTPFTLVQGAGRADWTALLHLLETPFYLLALWLLLSFAGIEGAAYAWTARILVDTIVLYAMAARLEPGLVRPAATDAVALAGLTATAGWIGLLAPSVWVRILLVGVFALICALRLLQRLRGAATARGAVLLQSNGKL